MANFRQVTFACLLLLLVLSQFADGLTCYSCTNNCNDPFDEKNAQQVTVADDALYSCAKYWVATGNVARAPIKFCTPNNVEGVGFYCCSTNLCNGANLMKSLNYLIYSLAVFLIVMLF